MIENTMFDPLAKIPQRWQELNKLWESSNTPQKTFCKMHGISYGQFTNWRSKIATARNKKQKQQQFAAVTVAEASPVKEKILPTTNTIKIELPDGIAISLPSNLDEKTLLLILSTLRGRP